MPTVSMDFQNNLALYNSQLTQWPEDTGAGDVMAPQDWHATFVVPMGAISTWVASGFTL